MTTTRRRWLARGAVVVLVGIGGLNLLAFNHAGAMMQFVDTGIRTAAPENLSGWSKIKVLLMGITVPRPGSNSLPSALAPDGQVLWVETPDGVTLESWYCDRGQASPLVLLFHGYSSNKESLLEEAKEFLALGASVLLVDFRGSGGSSESYTTIGLQEADDVAATVQHVDAHLSHTQTLLFGQSMGAVAILGAIHEHGISPDGVMLEAVFDTLLNTVRNRFHAMRVPSFPSAELLVFWGGQQRGFNGFRHNPVEYAVSLGTHALFMHGTDDPRATVAEAQRVVDAVSGPKTFKIFEQAGHASYLSSHPEAWRASVAEFVESVSQQSADPWTTEGTDE